MSQIVNLGSICEVIPGGRSKLTGSDFVPTGVPAFGAGGLNGYLPRAEFSEPAVVLSSIGARCGKCFLAEGEWASLANTQLIFPASDEVDVRFLWYQLNDELSWHRSGTAQPFIKTSDIKSRPVLMPPIEEQRRIAAILDQADELRAKRRASLALLDSLTQSIFLEMFGDPVANTAGWPIRELSEIVANGTIVTYGIVQAGGEWPGGVPYIRTGDLVGGEISLDGLRHTDPAIAERFSRSQVGPGEIVMSIRATVGTTAAVPPELDGANLTQGTARIAPGPDTDADYLLSLLRTTGVQRWIQRQVKGATFREITLKRLRELPVPVPPMALQNEFAARAIHARAVRESQRAQQRTLDELFASLRYEAFSGAL